MILVPGPFDQTEKRKFFDKEGRCLAGSFVTFLTTACLCRSYVISQLKVCGLTVYAPATCMRNKTTNALRALADPPVLGWNVPTAWQHGSAWGPALT